MPSGRGWDQQQAFFNDAAEKRAAQAARDKVAADPVSARRTAIRLSMWSSAAPALTPQMLTSISEAGIGVNDPTGQWLIRTAVPAIASRKSIGQQLTEGDLTSQMLADPEAMRYIKSLPLDQQERTFRHSIGQPAPQSPTLFAQQQSGQPFEASGLSVTPGEGYDWLKTGLRAVGTGLQAGAEATAGVFREGVADTAQSIQDIREGKAPMGGVEAHGQRDFKAPTVKVNLPEQLTNPLGSAGFVQQSLHPEVPSAPSIEQGKPFAVHLGAGGPAQDTLTPQITAVQALQGKSLGTGFFPGGEAHEAAVKAQKEAANINGHALTPGRALAAAVVEPGSRPYSIMSGLIDASVALKADPGAIALQELSSTLKAGRVFASDSDQAIASTAQHLVDNAHDSQAMTGLRAWAGEGDDLTATVAEKLRTNPGSLQQLVDQGLASHKEVLHAMGRPSSGIVSGLRNMVDQPTAMSWLNSKAGKEYADFAAENGFTKIWESSGKKLPADVAAKLHDAHTADEVRTILGTELGTTVRGVPETEMPYAWAHPFDRLRWSHYLPKGSIDSENIDHAVEQAQRTLIAAKVPREKWDDILKGVASAGNQPEMFDAYVNGVSGAVRQTLIDRGVNPRLAKTLTRNFPDDWDQQRRFFVDEMGNTPHIPGLTINGEPVPIDGPHLPSELLNRAIPPIDVRAIHRNVGLYGKIWNAPGLGMATKWGTYLADSLTGAFKVGALLKLALPVRFLADEQARMATAGMDSMFSSPLSYIAHALGTNVKNEGDILGERWADHLADQSSAYTRAIGKTAGWKSDIFGADRALTKNWVTYSRDSDGFVRSWADEVSQLHIDPVARETAKAVQDLAYAPAGITDLGGVDAVKEWGWSGAGKKWRQQLADANLWNGESSYLAHDRGSWDSYVDSVVDRIKIKTGGNDDVLDAIASGKPFKKVGEIHRDFKAQLADLADQGVGPQTVKGRATAATVGRPAVVRHVVDRLFSALMDAPTGKLTRSPAFKESYWKRVDELMPHMSESAQARALEEAAANGIRLRKVTGAAGELGGAEADQVAKAYALKTTRDLLYYPGERLGVTDNLRNVMPFGEAWRNVLTKWTKLAAENPVVGRRIEQGVTSLRSSGFFFNDPADGTEKFTLVPSDMMKHLAGVPFPLVAPVKGLNIVGTGLPGVGPAIQWPAAALLSRLPDNAVTDGLRQHLLPYGSPDFQGGAFESLFPGWMDKLKATGWFNQVPGLGQTANQQRVLTNVSKQVADYLVSTGQYDLSTQEGLDKLHTDAMDDAKSLYLWRGMAQFVAPAAPDYIPQVLAKKGAAAGGIPDAMMKGKGYKDGQLIETWIVAQDYKKRLDAAKGDDRAATLSFIKTWGRNLLFASSSMSRKTTYGVPTSAEGAIWRDQHSHFANSYRDVYGYWVPQQGQFSYQAYTDAIKRGDIETPDVFKWAELAQARLGNAIYDNLRSQLPPSPSQEQRNWLDTQKVAIQKLVGPGFNNDAIKTSRLTLDQSVDELKNAINDKTVAKTPLAHAADVYISLRDQALEEARRRSGSEGSGLSAKANGDLREWLYDKGTHIATLMPEFTGMWTNLFLSEVEPPAEAP